MSTHYLILAHYRPDLLKELVSALDGRSALVHIDRKSDIADFRGAVPGVGYLPDRNRVDVRWGAWSTMAAILELLKGIEPCVADDDYVVLLSGDSYPLRNPDAIDTWLSAQHGQQFIDSFAITDRDLEAQLRLKSVYLGGHRQTGWRMRVANWRGGFRRSLNASQLAGRTPRWGADWFALTGRAVRWFLKEHRTDAGFRNYMKLVRIPDEVYMATAFWNSPFREKLSPSLMYDDWSAVPPSAHPEAIRYSHVDLFVNTSLCPIRPWGSSGVVLNTPVLFARKFDSKKLMRAVQERVWAIP